MPSINSTFSAVAFTTDANQQIPLQDIPLPSKFPESTKAKEEDNDSASLSAESRNYSLDNDAFQEMLRKQLELLECLLNNLEDWVPSLSMSFWENLEELTLLYQTYLKHLLLCHSKEERPVLLQKYHQLLLSRISLLLEMHLPELHTFLESYSPPAAKSNLKSAVLFFITGRNQAAEMPGNTGLEKPGTVYHRKGHSASVPMPASHPHYKQETTISTSESKGFQNSQKEAHIPRNCGERNAFYLDPVVSDKSSARQTFKQLVHTEQFIKHLNRSGNLYMSPVLTAKNDELLGFLRANLALKAELFSEAVRPPSTVSSVIKDAVQTLSDRHMPTDSPTSSYRVYMHTMKLYQSGQSPKHALEGGLKYALEQFYSKKEAGNSTDPRYSEQSGFFQTQESSKPMQKILAENILLLEKDWKQFLYLLDKGRQSACYQAFSHYSPWAVGMNLSRSDAKDAERTVVEFPTIKVAIAAIACILGYFLFFL